MKTCGTYAGYQRHKRRGETSCSDCLTANRTYGKSWRQRNPERAKAQSRRPRPDTARWREANPEKVRQYHFVRRYGLTLAQIDEIFDWQDRKCACCGARLTLGRKRQWQVDHCHVSEQIRGVLCARCNRLLSQMGDCAAGVIAHCEWLLTYLQRAGDFAKSTYVFDGDRAPRSRRST